MPVATINPDAAMSRVRRSTLEPTSPMASIMKAEPNKARVATTPISRGPSPIVVR